jgi:hypothetical protein
MRKHFLTFLLAVSLLPIGASAVPPVLDNGSELIVAADFDGDGNPDLFIADKAKGAVRASFSNGDGTYTHLGPVTVARPLEEFSSAIGGIAAARFDAPDPNRIVVAGSGLGNLMTLELDKSSPALFGVPAKPLFQIESTGPTAVLALPVKTGGADPNLDGLLVGTSLNDGPDTGALESIINKGAAFESLPPSVIDGGYAVAGANPIPPDRGSLDQPYAGLVINDSLQLHTLNGTAPDPANPDFSLDGLAYGYTRFATGFFGPSLDPQVLLFSSGQQMVYAHPLTPGSSPKLAEPFFRNFPNAVSTVSVVHGAGGDSDRLLVTFLYGPVRAALYDYDGTNFPTMVSEFVPPEGMDFAGGIGLPNGEFLLLQRDRDGRIAGFSRHDFDGDQIDSATLPEGLPLSGLGNVIFYSDTPLANPAARVVEIRNAGDWTGGAPTSSPLPPSVSVEREIYAGSLFGLGSALEVGLGAPPSGADGVLANQFDGDISTFNFGVAAGTIEDQVSIQPAPGSYDQLVELEFTSASNLEAAASGNPATHDILYRIDAGFSPGEWTTYDAANPPRLARSSTVRFQSVSKSSGAKGNPGSASYTIVSDGDLDTDGDGVPDLVEIGAGLDPAAGVDTDGDGHSDLNELFAGTDPTDPSSNPGRRADGSRLPSLDGGFGSFDLKVSVKTRIDNGGTPATVAPTSDVTISAQSLEGGLVATAPTVTIASISQARLEGIKWEPDPLLVLTTPPNYGLASHAGNGGRQLGALVAYPELSSILPDTGLAGINTEPIAIVRDSWVANLREDLLPSSGTFLLSRGGVTSPITANATAAQLKTALDAMNSGTGVFGKGDATVSGEFPRFVVSAPAASDRVASEISAISSLSSPASTVEIVPRADTTMGGASVDFDILIMPSPQLASANLTVSETLLALLVEKKLGVLLGIAEPTIFPLREADKTRTPITRADLAALAAGTVSAAPETPATDPLEVYQSIRDALFGPSPSAAIQALLDTADAIYEFSSTQGTGGPVPTEAVIEGFRTGNLTEEETPEAMPAPIDALRAFLANGTISTTYTDQPASGVLSSAFGAVTDLLDLPAARPVFTGILQMGYSGDFEDPATLTTYSLLDSAGRPYPLGAAIPLQNGTRVSVTGFTDVAAPAGVWGTPLEVVSISLVSLPEQLGSDSDGNLLADDWEEMLLGATGADPYDTGAGGKSLLQLYLDGADPLLGSDTAVADLFPRAMALTADGDGSFTLRWKFPAAYADKFAYEVLSTTSLGDTFIGDYGVGSITGSGDDNELDLGTPGGDTKFWRLKLMLDRGGLYY